MFHPKKPSSSTMNISPHDLDPPMTSCVQGDSDLVLTTDPKPRLRWTVELHKRFVDSVAQLGGPDKATPKTIMRAMGVKGLTLYHLKSHLQKFRLGKQPHKDFNDHHTMKDGERASAFERQRTINASSSGMTGRSMNEMQMEVNRRLHEQLEVQRHLHLRIEAHGKYMQTILERACQTLSDESMTGAQLGPRPEISKVKDFGASMNFSSLQDLNIYGATSHDHQQLELHHNNMGRSSSMDSFMRSSNNNDRSNKNDNFLTKKRHNQYINNNGINRSGKSPLICTDDFRFRELGTAESSFLDDTQIQIAIGPLSMDKDR